MTSPRLPGEGLARRNSKTSFSAKVLAWVNKDSTARFPVIMLFVWKVLDEGWYGSL